MYGVIAFFAVFATVLALIVVLTARQRKIWKNRPAVLRAFAQRRGFQFVENPGKPADLVPLRPMEKGGNIKELELPAAVRGRTLDSQLTLLDMYTLVESGPGSTRKNLLPRYETFITFKSGERRWPHFEFAAVSHMKPDSLTGSLMTLVMNASESVAAQRGLKHVPIPDDPGCQLFMHDTANATATRDALMKLFAQREGWWVGAKDDTLTIARTAQKSSAMQTFVPEKGIDRFVDDSIEIERALRGLATPQ